MAKQERKDSGGVEILESGDIFMFVRPRVEEHAPEGREDIQNLHLVLAPEGRRLFRLALVGRKKLPDPSRRGRERNWGLVEAVERAPRKLLEGLVARRYRTKTRGERELPAARPVAEGVYQILRHDDHTHLCYALELPEEPGEVQEDLGIAEEASYILSIKNPEKPSPPAAGTSPGKKPRYPKELAERFRDRRFGEAEPPSYLDHEGTEFLLVAASTDVKEELGVDLDPDAESASSADIMKQLRLRRSEHPVEPLLDGEWA